MTVVVAVDFVDQMMLMGDTLVTRGTVPDTRFGLQKIMFRIDFKTDNVFFWAFSGSVYAGNAITEYIFERKLRNFKRTIAIAHLQFEIKGWMEEIAQQIPLGSISKTNFLLAGYENRRRYLLLKDGKALLNNPMPPPFYERHFYTYQINSDRTVEVNKHNGHMVVIGSGKDLTRRIAFNISEVFNTGRGGGMPGNSGRVFRARILLSEIKYAFESSSIATVGGPFMSYSHSVHGGLPRDFMWSSDRNHVPISVTDREDNIMVVNTASGESRPLLSLRNWFINNPQDMPPQNAISEAMA
jgi:hypothetical protein